VLDRPRAESPLPAEVLRAIDWRHGDFSRPEDAAPALAGADAVFHLAGASLPQDSNRAIIEEISGSQQANIQLAEQAAAAGVRRFVFASSGGAVYGRPQQTPISESHPTEPLSAYGVTKLATEKYLSILRAERGLDPVSLRIANPYGRYQRSVAAQGAVAVFIGQALAGKTIEIWGDGSVVRDFVAVEDVCRAFAAAALAAAPAPVMNVGSGRGHSLNELISEIEQTLGRSVAVTRRSPRTVDAPVNVLDIASIDSVLGWRPQIAFSDGVRHMINMRKEVSA
jgi:UDP-glucose 4-epimerase